MLPHDSSIVEGKAKLDGGMVEAGEAEEKIPEILGKTRPALSVDNLDNVLLELF